MVIPLNKDLRHNYEVVRNELLEHPGIENTATSALVPTKGSYHMGWYYLSTVMDDYCRFILSWRLCKTMMAEDVKQTLDMAIEWTGVDHVHVVHRPRLLSDNGSAYISKELRRYLEDNKISHIRTKPFHPMTQGKIERYHRSMKNIILLDHYYSPSELESRVGEWVEYYNNQRYHESTGNVTPADKYYGRDKDILKKRKRMKEKTIKERCRINKFMMLGSLTKRTS